jgi:FKBP-type peptidyl-prolyl cis-trans isomerase 2
VTIATGDVVTIEYVGRLDNETATVFDTSREQIAEESGLADAQPDREYTPLTVEVGAEQVIQGVDEGLVGLEAGENATLSIPPAKAYGEWSEDRVQEFDTAELEEMLGGQMPEEGAQLEAQNGQRGSVTHVDEEVVRVDFNSELAGKPLEFEIEVLEVD